MFYMRRFFFGLVYISAPTPTSLVASKGGRSVVIDSIVIVASVVCGVLYLVCVLYLVRILYLVCA